MPRKKKKSSLKKRAKAVARSAAKSVAKAMKKPVKRKRFPRGTEVQSLVFDKKQFTAREARSWAAEHNFKAPATDKTANTLRLRQKDPRAFTKGTYRTVQLRPGVKAVVAVPRKEKR